MDILLDTATHDLIFNNGPLTKEFTTQPFTQTVAQRLKIRLLTFREEYFMDVEYGVPYWQILGNKNKKESVDLIIQQEVLKEIGVKEITSFKSTFENRRYSCTIQVRVNSGEISQPITITI